MLRGRGLAEASFEPSVASQRLSRGRGSRCESSVTCSRSSGDRVVPEKPGVRAAELLRSGGWGFALATDTLGVALIQLSEKMIRGSLAAERRWSCI